MQGELFEPATLVLRDALVGDDGRVPLFVIGCSRDKLPSPAPAHELYTSSRFRSCVALACNLTAPFVILSGKHGIVDPDQVLEAYDLELPNLSLVDQRSWAAQAINVLESRAKGRKITVLATRDYCEPLIAANVSRQNPLSIIAPWLKLETPDLSVWLSEIRRMASRIHDLDQFYDWTAAQRRSGKVFSFAELSKYAVPKRGVYIFLDPAEPNFRANGPRVVRVGTHAVSAGSQASLRGRLRNHLGPATEIGNHRGSIFRLHVGRAMLEASPGRNLPTWGEGQEASQEIKDSEQVHELAVSRYLQKLEVALLNIDDESSKDSLRARVEAQLIALLSESMRPVDLPTNEWLGLKSPVPPIKQSGLWNIRGVGGKYDPAGIGSITSLLEA